MYQSAKEKLNALTKVAVPVFALTVAGIGTASATVAADISAAFATGGTNLGLAATGVIGMVAVVTGIGFIVSMLRK